MKLKSGIFVDGENVMRCGGWGMRYDVLRKFVEAQEGIILRANTYIAIDEERETSDPEYSRAKKDYRANLRRFGFKIVPKPVRRFRNADGEVITKANADLELAIDSVLQARNLDYVVLVTGDGDFVRLVNALQNMGCRVDVISFHNVNSHLREAADNYLSGFTVPGLLPPENGKTRGYLHTVYEDKYYGFITIHTGLRIDETQHDIFCHGKDVEGGTLNNRDFSRLKANRAVLEFNLENDDKGRRALNVSVLRMSVEDKTRAAAKEAARPTLPDESRAVAAVHAAGPTATPSQPAQASVQPTAQPSEAGAQLVQAQAGGENGRRSNA